MVAEVEEKVGWFGDVVLTTVWLKLELWFTPIMLTTSVEIAVLPLPCDGPRPFPAISTGMYRALPERGVGNVDVEG